MWESRERELAQPCHTSSRLEKPLNNSPSTLPVPSVRPSEPASGRRPRVDASVGMVKDQQQTETEQQRSSDEEDEQGGVVDLTVGTQPSSAQATTPRLPHLRNPPASSLQLRNISGTEFPACGSVSKPCSVRKPIKVNIRGKASKTGGENRGATSL